MLNTPSYSRAVRSFRSGNHGRLRPGIQILAPRFREDLCLDAGEVIEAAEGVVTPIDPLALAAG